MTDVPDLCPHHPCAGIRAEREKARENAEFDPNTDEHAGPHTKQETYERPKQ